MTEKMLERVVQEVRRVCRETGFGEVAVVIENGRVRKLRITHVPLFDDRIEFEITGTEQRA